MIPVDPIIFSKISPFQPECLSHFGQGCSIFISNLTVVFVVVFRPELVVKKLRYYARFIVVCLLLNKMDVVKDLVKVH